MNLRRHFQRAYTLVEMICVIAIISILMSLLLPVFVTAIKKALALADKLGS
ncbi:MAG: type II secretion system protein [Pedosphaera sp.]|nr:type II secretion system protein [Pedosphaera sp.]